MYAEGGTMGEYSVSLETINDFLAQKRIAMVGISREQKDFSVMLFEEFCRRGYEVIPVNPNASEVMGRRCFASVQEIQPPVDAVILMTSPAVTDFVVRDCAAAGIRRVWMYRAVGEGAVSAHAIEFCRVRGIQVVPGHCPFMFWRDAHLGHRVHGLILKITGSYPRRALKQAA
jgi:predicted CoA-binding protein